MLEKLLKAVKSSNKKRGRNITIGAVVGLLLSCTAVMGADEYLWIRNDSGKIEFNTEATTTTDGSDGDWKNKNPYEENSWDGTNYINNIILSSNANNGKFKEEEYARDISYGLRLSGNLGNFNFINNGMVSGTSDSDGSGIYISNSTGGVDIKNEGVINGTAKGAYIFGIKISELIGSVSIKNEGVIRGTGIGEGNTSGYGIQISKLSELVDIKNEGVINGNGNGDVFGIKIFDSIGGVDIKNKGLISGTGYGSGIKIYELRGSTSIKNQGVISGTASGINIYDPTVENITNTGVVYGSTNAIYKESGTVNSAVNYGILANGKEEAVVDGLTVVAGTPTPAQNEL